MPGISLFRGIRICMHYDGRIPPHFHVEYAGYRCIVDILADCVIAGNLPARQLKLALAWNELHNEELLQNWELAKDCTPLDQVDPL